MIRFEILPPDFEGQTRRALITVGKRRADVYHSSGVIWRFTSDESSVPPWFTIILDWKLWRATRADRVAKRREKKRLRIEARDRRWKLLEEPDKTMLPVARLLER